MKDKYSPNSWQLSPSDFFLLSKSVMVSLWTSAASPWRASPFSTFPACTAAPTFGARARRRGVTARGEKRAKTRGHQCSTPKSSCLQFKVTLAAFQYIYDFNVSCHHCSKRKGPACLWVFICRIWQK